MKRKMKTKEGASAAGEETRIEGVILPQDQAWVQYLRRTFFHTLSASSSLCSPPPSLSPSLLQRVPLQAERQFSHDATEIHREVSSP